MRAAPIEAERDAPLHSLMAYGVGVRLAIAALACGLLWLTVFWAMA
jgi:hypothetical protein